MKCERDEMQREVSPNYCGLSSFLTQMLSVTFPVCVVYLSAFGHLVQLISISGTFLSLSHILDALAVPFLSAMFIVTLFFFLLIIVIHLFLSLIGSFPTWRSCCWSTGPGATTVSPSASSTVSIRMWSFTLSR